MGTGVILLLPEDRAMLSWTEVTSRDPLRTPHAKSLMLVSTRFLWAQEWEVVFQEQESAASLEVTDVSMWS